MMSMGLLKSLVVSAVLILVVAAVLMAAGQLGWLAGQRPTNLGVRDGRLKPPPPTPNAVSSQAGDDAHHIEPLRFAGDPARAFARLRDLIAGWPGARIVAESPGYLHAEVSTPWLRFVDDLEVYLDGSANVIHVRSASRLGHSDFGTNRRRVEAIRQQFAAGAG